MCCFPGLCGLGRALTGKERKEGELRVDTGMEVDKYKLCPLQLGHRCVTGTIGAECATREV